MDIYTIVNKTEHQRFTVKAANATRALQKALGIYSMLEAEVMGWHVIKEKSWQSKVH